MRKNQHVIESALCFVAVIVCSMFFMAAEVDAVSETSRTDYTLMEGVTESTVYVTDSEGVNLQAHILRVQKGAAVSFKATTKGYYSSGSTKKTRTEKAKKWKSKSWGFKTLKKLASDYNNSKDAEGTVIAATNGDFYDKETLKPLGRLVIEGNILREKKGEPFFAVLDNGSWDIRGKDGSIKDAYEVVSGSRVLVAGGENLISDKESKEREPRQGIGVCPDGTVVIINVDGRSPVSAGASFYDFAEIFRQQGCVRAINFDGGGSATFLTKRQSNSSLVYRNVKGDGFERKVTASLLVVKNSESAESDISGASTVSMEEEGTALVKKDGVWRYTINGEPASGFYAINGKCYLFDSKGKGRSKKVKIGNVTYTFEKGQYKKASDSKAGKVIIGYCGSASDGKNLLYAYQYGNKKLKVGLNPLKAKKNGKMKNWTETTRLALPWYSMRSDIKNIYIGDGVTRVGSMFMYVAGGKVFDGTTIPTCQLTSIRLPSSLTTIGKYAFYNKPKLKNITIPAKVTSIGQRAFAQSGKGYLKFKGKKVPKFGTKALSLTGFTKVYVRNNSAYKKFVKAGKFKKYGYKKTVKYY